MNENNRTPQLQAVASPGLVPGAQTESDTEGIDCVKKCGNKVRQGLSHSRAGF